MHPKVDEILDNAPRWQQELKQLRNILLACGLIEEVKWGSPCYCYKKSNIAIIGGFKEFCVLSFFKGALLNNEHGLLTKQGENVQSARVIKFVDTKKIIEYEAEIKSVIFEAIEVEKSGAKVIFKETKEFDMPVEFQNKLDEIPELKSAFEALTPGRQKGYLLHFSAAKQPKTRQSRIENNILRILDGKGIHDCICGHSKKMPACDGSHKNYS